MLRMTTLVIFGVTLIVVSNQEAVLLVDGISLLLGEVRRTIWTFGEANEAFVFVAVLKETTDAFHNAMMALNDATVVF